MKKNSLVDTLNIFYKSITKKDTDKMMSFFNINAVLTFASYDFKKGEKIDDSHAFSEIKATYEFKGKKQIKKMLIEFLEMFIITKCIHRQFFLKDNKVFHIYGLELKIQNNRGLMQIHTLYDFENQRINRMQIRFLPGYLILKNR